MSRCMTPNAPGATASKLLLQSRRAMRRHAPTPAKRGRVGKSHHPCAAFLLDLGFAERNVLAHYGVVFLQLELTGLRTGVLLRHVEVPGVGAGHEFDLNGVGLGHGMIPSSAERCVRLPPTSSSS